MVVSLNEIGEHEGDVELFAGTSEQRRLELPALLMPIEAASVWVNLA